MQREAEVKKLACPQYQNMKARPRHRDPVMALTKASKGRDAKRWTKRMSDIEFHSNGFVILDLVPEGELQTGKKLEDEILDLIQYENKTQLYCERHRCLNKQEFIHALENIKVQLREKGETPYIHIEGHGSKEGLKLLDDSLLSWDIIFHHFREINILCKNNLFFSSGACQSAYAFKATSIMKACPVFGLLAPEQVVQAGGVSDGFIAFYRKLINTGSLNDAFNAFADKTDGKKYALIFSQLIFKKACFKYIKEQCMGKGRKKRLEEVLSTAVQKIDMPIRQLRKSVKKEIYGSQAKNLNTFHRVFMMIDLYPENQERFQFNAIEFEKEVRKGIKIV